MDGFDGVTIAEFDANMKICDLKEFQSKAEHCWPYEDNILMLCGQIIYNFSKVNLKESVSS